MIGSAVTPVSSICRESDGRGDDELAPAGIGFRLRQGFELQAADEIEQRPVLGPDAGELHASVAEPAQKQRARRIETAEVGEIERALLALFQRLLQRLLRFR